MISINSRNLRNQINGIGITQLCLAKYDFVHEWSYIFCCVFIMSCHRNNHWFYPCYLLNKQEWRHDINNARWLLICVLVIYKISYLTKCHHGFLYLIGLCTRWGLNLKKHILNLYLKFSKNNRCAGSVCHRPEPWFQHDTEKLREKSEGPTDDKARPIDVARWRGRGIGLYLASLRW